MTYNDDRTGAGSGSGAGDTTAGHYPDERTFVEPTPRVLSRPTGPSWGTVALGLICMIVAAGAIFLELTNIEMDWSLSGPMALIGLGVVLVLVGLAALSRRDDDKEDHEPGR